MYHSPPLSVLLKRFDQLIRQLLRTGRPDHRRRLTLHLQHLWQRLRIRISGRHLRRRAQRILLAAGISSLPFLSNGQSLQLGESAVDTLGLSRLGVLSPFYTFYDYDQDGDLDLISTPGDEEEVDRGIIGVTFNEGNDSIPLFGDSLLLVELDGFDEASTELLSPEWVDIDDDGDLDLFVGTLLNEYNAPVLFFENEQTQPGPPQLANAVLDPFGIDVGATDSTDPTFVDIDGDGDFDLFTNAYFLDGTRDQVIFLENTGTATAPSFAAPVFNPFGISTLVEQPFFDFADLDVDGDLDLVIAGDNRFSPPLEIEYLENTGTATAPAFASGQTGVLNFGPISSGFSVPELADIDWDGDPDLFALGETALDPSTQLPITIFLYVENEANPVTALEDPEAESAFQLYPTITRDYLYLEWGNLAFPAQARLRVVDAQGRVVVPNQPIGITPYISVRQLPAGAYWVQVESAIGTTSRPFFKIR